MSTFKPLHRFHSQTYKYSPQEITFSVEEMRMFINKFNGMNRILKREVVNKYKAQFLAGEWQWQTGNTIKFNVDGHILSGFHRFSAFIELNMPFTAIVAYGIAVKAALVEDTQRQRDFMTRMINGNGEQETLERRDWLRASKKIVNIILNDQTGKWRTTPRSDTDIMTAIEDNAADMKVVMSYGDQFKRAPLRAVLTQYYMKDKTSATSLMDFVLKGDLRAIAQKGSRFDAAAQFLQTATRQMQNSSGGGIQREEYRSLLTIVNWFHTGITPSEKALAFVKGPVPMEFKKEFKKQLAQQWYDSAISELQSAAA